MPAGSGGGTHFLPPSLELTPLPLGYLVGGLSLVPDLHWVPVSSEGSCFSAKIHSLNTWETCFPWRSKAQGSFPLPKPLALSFVLWCPQMHSFIFFRDISVSDSAPTWLPFPKDEQWSL